MILWPGYELTRRRPHVVVIGADIPQAPTASPSSWYSDLESVFFRQSHADRVSSDYVKPFSGGLALTRWKTPGLDVRVIPVVSCRASKPGCRLSATSLWRPHDTCGCGDCEDGVQEMPRLTTPGDSELQGSMNITMMTLENDNVAPPAVPSMITMAIPGKW